MKVQSIYFATLITISIAHPEFEAAAKYVSSSEVIPLTDKKKLKVYALYKQATLGDCGEFTGRSTDRVAVIKHASWCAEKGMNVEDARFQYVAKVSEFAPSWRS